MKKTWFDARLYREGLRQLRVIGILSFVVMALGAILVPVGEAISYSSQIAVQTAQAGAEFNPEIMTLMRAHPLLMLGFPVLAPIMSLYLFHFLDRRSSSDFYHVIPQTRNCLFLSLTAALLTWLFVILWGSAAICLITCKLLGKYLVLTTASVPALVFTMTAASLLVAASVLLAVSITGTLFTNIVVSLLVIFLPRAVMLVMSICLSSAMPYVSDTHLFPLMDYSWNVITGIMFGWFTGVSGQVIYSYSAGAYTLILAVLYGILARFMFVRRKSEAAGQAAPSRKMQAVFRLAVSMTICLIPIGIVFSLITNEDVTGSSLFGVAVLYLIAVMVYFVYELIATRKLRNLAAAVPGLGILAALNVVFIFGMFGIYRYTESQQPAPDEISYVTLQAGANSAIAAYSYSYDSSEVDYFDAYLEEIRLDSPEVRKLVSERLSETIRYYTDGYEGGIGGLLGSNNIGVQLVAIKNGGRTLYRNIFLTEADRKLIMEEYKEKEEVRQLFGSLPENDRKTTTVRSIDRLTNAAAGRVYAVLREEAAQTEFDEWYALVQGMENEGEATIVGRVMMQTYKDNQLLTCTLPVSTKMPRTFAQYVKEYQAVNQEDLGSIAERLKKQDAVVTDCYASGFEQGVNRFYTNLSFSINPYGEEDESENKKDWEESRTCGRELGELLDLAGTRQVEADGDFMLLQVTFYEEEQYHYLEVYLAAGQDDLPDLMQKNLQRNDGKAKD